MFQLIFFGHSSVTFFKPFLADVTIFSAKRNNNGELVDNLQHLFADHWMAQFLLLFEFFPQK